MARYLAILGHELILVARRKDRLEQLKQELNTKVKIISLDLSIEDNCLKLYHQLKKDNIDILINNAGFGLFGMFNKTDLTTELEMINLNIKCVHILTKLFLQDFIKKNHGYILNVASSAGFLAGPRLNTYYATKNYVLKLTLAIYEELRHQNSNVKISCLCPGPVATEFNKVAHGKFSIKEMSSFQVAEIGIDQMFKNKLIIVPGLSNKLGLFFTRFLPYKWQLKIIYKIQKRKSG